MWKDLSFNYYQILTGFSHTPAVNSFPYPQWLQRKKEVSFWLPLVLQWNGNTDHFRLTSVEYKGASVLTWVMFSWEPHLVALLCLPLWPLMHSSQKTPEPCGQDIWVSRSPSSLRCFLNAWLSWPSVSTQKQVISLGSLLASLHPGYIPSLDRKTVNISSGICFQKAGKCYWRGTLLNLLQFRLEKLPVYVSPSPSAAISTPPPPIPTSSHLESQRSKEIPARKGAGATYLE